MGGQSFGTLKNSGMKHREMSHQNQRTGPSNKNLGPSRKSVAHPAGAIRSTGQQVKGPDKGAGGR
jgi:hypothetical protein